MAHEQDDPAVGKLITITVVGTLVAILVAFFAYATWLDYERRIPTEYSKDQ